MLGEIIEQMSLAKLEEFCKEFEIEINNGRITRVRKRKNEEITDNN